MINIKYIYLLSLKIGKHLIQKIDPEAAKQKK